MVESWERYAVESWGRSPVESWELDQIAIEVAARDQIAGSRVVAA